MNDGNCTLQWCRADHDDDTERFAHHQNHIGQFTAKTVTIDVIARWAEPLDGQQGVLPHVSLIMETAGEAETPTLDLTPREARIWAGQLAVFNGAPWLVDKLTEGADMLTEWEFNEFDEDTPHRVTEFEKRHTPAAYLIALQAAAQAARDTLEGFERLPTSALDALELMKWVGEYRGVVRSMVESVDALADNLDAVDVHVEGTAIKIQIGELRV